LDSPKALDITVYIFRAVKRLLADPARNFSELLRNFYVEQILPDLFHAEAVSRCVKVIGELPDGANAGLLSARAPDQHAGDLGASVSGVLSSGAVPRPSEDPCAKEYRNTSAKNPE
jgi:hypothetical protein